VSHSRKTLASRIRARFSAVSKGTRRKALIAVILLLPFIPLVISVVNRQPASAYPCPCNVFGTPSGQSEFDDGSDLELGFKFKAQIDGYITGVRFYKQGAMSGTHVGHLWETDGTPLATATFDSESGSGWQDVTFSSPVPVTADTLYVASVSMPDGRYIATPNYFTTDRTNYPLVAPSSANAGGNGVFTTNAGDFPSTNSGNSASYWIDVDFKATTTPVAPNVDTVTPTDDATGALPGETLTATFDFAMNPDSFTSSSFIVQDSEGNTLDTSVSFSTSTEVASLVADDGFEAGQTYTATLKGGTGSTVQNIDGTPMASDYSWSFTVASTNACPCSLMDRSAPEGAITADEVGSVELGIKLTPLTNGYLTAVRFYKPIVSTVSTHTVNIWSSTGSNLATATSSDESDYGWQEVKLSTPLKVSKGTLYVVSFTTSDGIYMAKQNAVSSDISNGYLIAYANGDSRNAATGSGNGNGVFNSSGGNYPGSAFNASYYWVDAVFATSPTATSPLAPDSVQPSSNSYGVVRPSVITARMNRPVDPTLVNGATVTLEDGGGAAVTGTASYDATTHTIQFTPTSSLDYGTRYTVTLDGSIADNDGVTLADDYTWSFTTGSQLSADPELGPGGPVLVVTDSTDPYSQYYAEILRAEGINYFEVKDIADVSSGVLSSYDAVVLAEMSLNATQVDMLNAWVNAGGDLVAMRPDSKLANLLGIQPAGTTRTSEYLAVDTSASPGEGIVSDTIQFKGTGDNYTLDGATGVATFYSDASTSTSNPAVTYRSVGSNGGSAASFAYDLAKSVIALHQGNQAWAGTDRDGDSTIRTNDLYFGAKTGDVQPDFVDLNKIHIPQADEQQRLLANILTEAKKDSRPLPRFWYLPHDYEAAVVFAGDDHGLPEAGGIQRPFNDLLNNSPTDCSLIDWQCKRSSGYVYFTSGFTNSRAAQFIKAGFEVASHTPDAGGCANYTSYANLGTLVSASLASFQSKYTSAPDQRTNRYHCYVWSDWDSQPRVDYDNGIRYDLDYTTYPSSWIGSRAAIITGSGMNMRLTDASGALLDVYQGVTNFENTVTAGSTVGTVLANATGSNGYYGIFGTHFDMSDTYHTTLYNNTPQSVPIISSDQALTWLDGRGSSKFSNFSGSGGRYNFRISAAEGAVGLRAMMPTEDAGGTVTSITLAGSSVSYQTQQVKGVSYAVFDARPGDYTITYSDYAEPTDDDGGSPSGGSSGSGGQEGSSTGSSSKKKVSQAIPGISNLMDEAPENTEEQGNTPSTPERDGQSEDKTIVQETGDEDSQLGRWLVGIGLVGLLGGIFVGLAIRRHRHTPTW
jgi:hypothetical protein